MNEAPGTHLPRLAVLVSGNGSNLQAVLDACADGRLKATVAVVVSNKRDAYGLERAQQAGVPAVVKPKRAEQDRRGYDAELAEIVQAFTPDWVILAGWMRVLSAAFLDAFPGKVINLHPALPGTFPGTHAIDRALEAYRRGEIQETGVMVHFVPDEGVDCGPIIAQERVEIRPEDTLETLEERVHETEHRLLVEAIASVVADVIQ